MACDTFIKIAQKCRRQFVQIQVGEVMPFIDELLANINSIICDLQPQQVGYTVLCKQIFFVYRYKTIERYKTCFTTLNVSQFNFTFMRILIKGRPLKAPC